MDLGLHHKTGRHVQVLSGKQAESTQLLILHDLLAHLGTHHGLFLRADEAPIIIATLMGDLKIGRCANHLTGDAGMAGHSLRLHLICHIVDVKKLDAAPAPVLDSTTRPISNNTA